MRVRHVRGTSGKRRTVRPSLPLYYVSDFDVIEVPEGKSPREALSDARPDLFGPDMKLAYRVVHPTDEPRSADGGVDPDEEATWVHECVCGHGVDVPSAVTKAIIEGHYAFLFHLGLLRNEWGYGFPEERPLLDAAGCPVLDAAWVSLRADPRDRLREQLSRLCREGRRVYERRNVNGQPVYERVFVSDDGLTAWIRGKLPYQDPEELLGVYRLAPDAVAHTALGDRLPFEDNPSVGPEEIPWIIDHWGDTGKGDAPEPAVVSGVLEAQFRYLCAQGVAEEDPEGWRPYTSDEIEAAVRAYRAQHGEKDG